MRLSFNEINGRPWLLLGFNLLQGLGASTSWVASFGRAWQRDTHKEGQFAHLSIEGDVFQIRSHLHVQG